MQIGYRIRLLLLLLVVSNALLVFSFQRAMPTQFYRLTTTTTTTLFGADPGIDLSITPDSVDLSKVGSDIDILPPQNGAKRVVMKFGGSSIANAERITYVAKLIKKHVDKGYQPILVCSAMGKTTNSLLSSGDSALKGEIYTEALRNLHISTAKTLDLPPTTIAALEDLLSDVEKLLNGIKYIGELSPRTRDTLVSFGERMSVRVMAATLVKLGVLAKPFDAWTLGLKTNSEFGNADIKDESYDAIRMSLDKFDLNSVPVITGFIGHDDKGRITTLGRGGSDLTATFFGSAVGVDEIQVWKDVDGIMTTDPRLVSAALPVNAITYEEAAELAYFGAEVLHPISMQPAIRTNTPVRVKNSYNPKAPGTAITYTRDKQNSLVTAITAKTNVQLVDIVSTRMLDQFGFLSKVFAIFERNELSVDVVASSEVSLSLTLDKKMRERAENIKKLVRELSEFSEVTILEDRAIISLISNIDKAAEVLATTFTVMDRMGIKVEMLSQGASKVNISLVIPMKDKDRLIKALHAAFFEGAIISSAYHD